jgi:CHAD domain-containing protein
MPIARERVRFIFKRTESDLSKLAAKRLPDNVHGFRTTARRLQTLLEELAAEGNRNQKKLLKSLDGIRKRAGKVRNVDVQLTALRSLKIAQEPRRKTQLMHELLELRAKHEKKLHKALTREVMREVEKRLKRASKEIKFKADCDPLAVARRLLSRAIRPGETEAATKIESKKLEPKKPQSKPGIKAEASLHQCRIVIKRARYVAEFAPKSAEATAVISQLQALQDTIGNWHDWQALTNSAAEHLGDVSQSSLVAALHNLAAGKMRGAMAAVAAATESPAIPKAPTTLPSHPRKPDPKTLAMAEQTDSAA